MIGFCFDRTKDTFVNPQEAQQIINWLEGPKIVGEFDGQNVKEMREVAMILNLDMVQFPMPDNTAGFEEIAQEVIVELAIQPADTLAGIEAKLQPWKGIARYVQLNLRAHFENWVAFKKASLGVAGLQQLINSYPVIVDVLFELNDLDEVSALQPELLNLITPPESELGLKSFEGLQEILDVLAEF